MADLKELTKRPTADYLVQNRNWRISESFADRDRRYQEVDALLRGEFGYKLPGDNLVVEEPMIMNLGLAFTQDVARLTVEQTPVYKAPVFGDGKNDYTNAHLREVIGETYWIEGRGDLLVPQQAIDMVVCGAAYTVCWVDGNGMYPKFGRIDPRHAYPTIQNGEMLDLFVVHVFPAAVAQAMFPHASIPNMNGKIKDEVEIWEYYKPGYASRWIAYLNVGGQADPSLIELLEEADLDDDIMPAYAALVPTHDGAIRGSLDQLGNALMAKNKIASLMAKYTEHKLFAPWEERGILNSGDTPGPNTVYHHDPNAPNETFMRRVQPSGSDPALFALMQLLDEDQRGAIGYPSSRQGEVSQSIASAAFVESTQGQLSSIVKSVQMLHADMRSDLTETLMKMDVRFLDFKKPLARAVDGKNTYIPSRDIKDRSYIRVAYGAGAGMSRANADTRLLNLLGARLIDRGTARDNVEFLRDRSDIQDKIEMENAEDSLQQLFWPDPTVPIDVKFKVKKVMQSDGLNLTDAWDKVQAEMATEAEAAQQAAPPEAGIPAPPTGQVQPEQATDQALALDKGQIVAEPADIELPSAPLEQIFVGG